MIHVIGDIIIDEYWYGKTTRISPEAPVPIVELKSKTVSLGGAANVYANIKSLSDNVQLHGMVEQKYRDHFSNKSNLFVVPKMPVKIRVLSEGHYVTRIDDEECVDNTKLIHSLQNNKLEGIVFLSDYDKGTLSSPQKIIKQLSNKVIVDPKISLENYKGAWILKPNRKEFESYVGKTESIEELTTKAIQARKELEVDNLIVTLSEHGVLWVSDKDTLHIPTEAKSVYDVTGAGDTFGAVLAYALDMGYNMEKALMLANKASAKAISKQGTYVIQPEDLL